MAKFRNGNIVISSGQSLVIDGKHITGISDDPDMTSDSEFIIPTQKATKGYSDTHGGEGGGNPFLTGYGFPAADLGEPDNQYVDLYTNDFYIKDEPSYGLINLFVGGIATATHRNDDAPLAVDGNIGTSWFSWTSASNHPSWTYDLGEGNAEVISKLSVRPRNDSVNCNMKAYEIFGSNDNIVWVSLHSAEIVNEVRYHNLEFSNSIEYRYIRIEITSTYQNYPGLAEVEGFDAAGFTWKQYGKFGSTSDRSNLITEHGVPDPGLGDWNNQYINLDNNDFYIKDEPSYGLTNLFTGGTASASAGADPEKAVDGDIGLSSVWTTNLQCWWKYDFGEGIQHPISQLKLIPHGDMHGAYFKDYEIFGSNDNSLWVSLHAGTIVQNVPNYQTDWRDLDFSNDVIYRYIRINILSSYELILLTGIREVQAYDSLGFAWRLAGKFGLSTEIYDGNTSVATDSTSGISFNSSSAEEATINEGGLALSQGVRVNEFSNDDTLAGDSDQAIPTEKAIKAYIEARVIAILGEQGLI